MLAVSLALIINNHYLHKNSITGLGLFFSHWQHQSFHLEFSQIFSVKIFQIFLSPVGRAGTEALVGGAAIFPGKNISILE